MPSPPESLYLCCDLVFKKKERVDITMSLPACFALLQFDFSSCVLYPLLGFSLIVHDNSIAQKKSQREVMDGTGNPSHALLILSYTKYCCSSSSVYLHWIVVDEA